MKEKKPIAATVRALAEPVAEELGFTLWDVEYVKEGADMILRITIDSDKEGGIDIDDCEKMHRRIDTVLDEADPIENAYMLAVSSPGVERVLTEPFHYEKMAGEEVEIRLFAPVDGTKVFRGRLIGYDSGSDTVTADIPGRGETKFPRKSIAKCTTVYEW